MGIQAREDIPSTISVLRKDGSSVDLLDYAARTGNAKTSVYTNFICQKITRVENEKIQIQETWGKTISLCSVSGLLYYRYKESLSLRLTSRGKRSFGTITRILSSRNKTRRTRSADLSTSR